MLNRVFRLIKESFNQRLTIYSAVVLVFTLFGSLPTFILKLPFLFALIPLDILFLFIISKNFIYPSFRLAFLCRKSITIPAPNEFQALAKRMGTTLKEIKIINSDKENAFATRNGIAFTTKLLEKFHKNEIMVVTTHELAHKKGHHVLYRMLIIAAVMIATIFNWSRFTAPILFNLAFSLSLFQILANTALLAFMMIVMIPVSWYLEGKADVAAAKFAGKRWTLSVLRKLCPKEDMKQHSETHLSIYERIKNIENLKMRARV